jgi:hypothetical protein
VAAVGPPIPDAHLDPQHHFVLNLENHRAKKSRPSREKADLEG